MVHRNTFVGRGNIQKKRENGYFVRKEIFNQRMTFNTIYFILSIYFFYIVS